MKYIQLNISEEEFKKLYEEKTRTELSNILEISGYYVDKIAKQLGLKKDMGRRVRRYE